ncbi:MAG: inner membrane protein YpjD, partial [Burkholderiales bacterium]
MHFWRTHWRSAAPRAAGIGRWERAAILAPFALHTWLLYQELLAAPGLRFGFGQALSVTLWLTVLIYWVESRYVNLEGMPALVLPVAAVCVALPAAFPGLASPPYAASLGFRAHLLLAMLAYSLLTIAALHALLMALLERQLHGGRRDGGAASAASG